MCSWRCKLLEAKLATPYPTVEAKVDDSFASLKRRCRAVRIAAALALDYWTWTMAELGRKPLVPQHSGYDQRLLRPDVLKRCSRTYHVWIRAELE